ncbi:ATP-binding protein [Spirosoma rhododendri]|uniref:histidine kinase n=1 Tax=Spirosoma rhododendri TaxID=2728024 RepID=A0A7L5DTZ9_9BACT|nr:ATP-binding protein [Spirosoma rhododendri]QJD80783.1 HAMP domain-containing protein [Spirosoma rhododendri]
MSLKAKISTALVFVFVILLTLGGLSMYYLNQLADDSQAILKDNYISLEYVSSMQKALANRADPDALTTFERNLKKQETNITEAGEQTPTDALRREFDRLKARPTDSMLVPRVQQHLFQIDDLNRQAIVRKSDTAKRTAKEALGWVAVVGTFSFLILFSFIVNFPGYIADPLRELTRGIRQITSRNFEERLRFKSSDEFGELARSFNSMAQKLDEYEHSNLARVLFEKKRIDTLIEVLNDGIIGLDENRRILFINPVAERLLGVQRERLVGRYAPDVATTNDLLRTLIQGLVDGFEATNADEHNVATGDTMLKIYDPGTNGKGRESYFTRQVSPVEVPRTGETEPTLAGYVIVLKNVTSYKELDLAKTNFIATVSHELKTPLSSIKMSLKLLDDSRVGAMNEEQTSLIGNVRADTDRLLNLTGELLNMAQVESGQIQLQVRPVGPATLIQTAIGALRMSADQKNVRFSEWLAPNLPSVLADPDKASWVLINFLSNAVRHSPPDNRIDVSVKPLGDRVEFRVRDHGAGIRPEHRDRIFDRYFRAPGTNGQASGTGLGLAISSEFIAAMNGQIGLDDSVTDGAAFYFLLPVA